MKMAINLTWDFRPHLVTKVASSCTASLFTVTQQTVPWFQEVGVLVSERLHSSKFKCSPSWPKSIVEATDRETTTIYYVKVSGH